MNKSEIKTFAIWARNKLIADSVYKASLLGITENGIQNPLPQSTSDAQLFDIGMKEPYAITGQEIDQRRKLVAAIKNKQRDLKYKDAFQNVMEEAAYTWFNRLIAIRFMEVNDYMPSHIRVLSSENPGKTEPDLVTTPFDSDLQFKDEEKQQIIDLKNENKTDDVFRMLFIKQCNALNESLPMLFEKISDYTELLLNISITDRDGVVWHLVHDIPENNFDVNAVDEDGKPMGQVEIIGWLYQYYNTEPKDKVFANLKKNIKITKETIPAATQLFTPDWIVRYMVENSLGRLWIEGHPNDDLKAGWKYYLDEAEQEPDVQKQLDQIYAEHAKLKPEDITCMDPCCGSGHILVYMFEVLMQIYQSQGYSAREAAVSIVEHNIYGLDIDKRAVQLAYFAVMMKARQYDRRFLTRGIQPQVFYIEESNGINRDQLKYFGADLSEIEKNNALNQVIGLLDQMQDAREYGSILIIDNYDWSLLHKFVEKINIDGQITFDSVGIEDTQELLQRLINLGEMLSRQYEVVVTNPPYMSASGMELKLSNFIKKEYPNSKSDFYSVFMQRADKFAKINGYTALITMETWMFLSSFEKLRKVINDTKTIINMVHMPYLGKGGTSLGINFGTSAVVMLKKMIPNYLAQYEYIVYYECDSNGVPYTFPTINSRWKTVKQTSFSKIPGAPIAYWASDKLFDDFSYEKIEKFAISDGQTKTGDNEQYLRYAWEVNSQFIGKNEKWAYIAKGGNFRRWAGNIDTVINWSDKARQHYRKDHVARIAPEYIWFRRGVCWNHITSNSLFAARYIDENMLFETAAPAVFFDDEDLLYYIIGYLNTPCANIILKLINPTMCTNVGDITSQPLIIKDQFTKDQVIKAVKRNIQLSSQDWNSFEPSLYFRSNFVSHNLNRISNAYENWKSSVNDLFNEIKANEEKINSAFINTYSLAEEANWRVDRKNVTVHYIVDELSSVESDDIRGNQYLLNRSDVVKQFISYVIGCMFGRYSLDVDGLVYAGGDWDDSKYKTFLPDADNVIPITDEEYLDDDIVGRFVQFVKVVYGEQTLEENLTFIADALGGKGKSSREVIRNYFLKDFFKDHCKTYQKRPIYWLYDSGKQNGFKALVYLHRMDENTTGKVRADYLHRIEQIYGNEVIRMQDVIDHDKSAHQVSLAEKRMDKLKKQIKECQDYDAKLGHLALDQIKLNLDDGVKVNYRKAQTGRDGKFYEVLADSKNIMANDALWKEYLTEWPHEEE